MKSKYILYYYIISIFLLANGSFATALFQMLHFNIWRQAIWVVGMYIFIQNALEYESDHLPYVFKVHKNLFYIIVLLSLLTMATYLFNPVRIVYAWWMYFSGLPFVLFPYFVSVDLCLYGRERQARLSDLTRNRVAAFSSHCPPALAREALLRHLSRDWVSAQ